MKPDDKIYQTVINEIDSDPKNIYFFDDKKINVDKGSLMGINSYQVTGGKPLIERLKALELLK